MNMVGLEVGHGVGIGLNLARRDSVGGRRKEQARVRERGRESGDSLCVVGGRMCKPRLN